MRTIRLSFPWHRVVALFFACLVCTALWAGGCPGSTGRQGHPPPRAGQLRQPGRPGPQALRPGPNLGPDHPLLLEGVTSAPEAEAILQANLGLLTQTAQAPSQLRGTIIPSRSVWRKPGSPPGNTRTWPPRRELPGPAGAHR